METVGSRIKRYRQAANLTQEGLGTAADVAAVTIRQYERGLRIPTLQMLEKLADALHVNPAQLAGWDQRSEEESDDSRYLARLLRENDDNVSLTLEQLQGALDDVDERLRVLTAQLNKAFNTLSFAIHSVDAE